MYGNIIKLVDNECNLDLDLAEFERDIKAAKSLSSDKVHLQTLLAEIATSENVDQVTRLEAARVLLETSDIFAIFDNISCGKDMIVKIIKEKMGDLIRH